MIALLVTSIYQPSPASQKQSLENRLIEGLQADDSRTFHELYDLYAANLMGFIFKIIPQRETAEDLLQEVFLKIKKNILSYDSSKSRLFTWMLHIARNTAIDHLRLNINKNLKSHINMEDASGELQNHLQTFNTDTIGIRELVNKLCSKQKHILGLFYYKGYTHAEIAELLDMPLGSVKTSIRQAILELRKSFGQAGTLNKQYPESW